MVRAPAQHHCAELPFQFRAATLCCRPLRRRSTRKPTACADARPPPSARPRRRAQAPARPSCRRFLAPTRCLARRETAFSRACPADKRCRDGPAPGSGPADAPFQEKPPRARGCQSLSAAGCAPWHRAAAIPQPRFGPSDRRLPSRRWVTHTRRSGRAAAPSLARARAAPGEELSAKRPRGAWPQTEKTQTYE